MRFGSVCSGIEAASVAWHPLGWSAAWLAEIEPFPSAVLAHHYPNVPNYGDMKQLPWLIAAGLVEAPELLCGGTPCQAFSVAGLRRSLDDARGNLSLTFCEIANAIDDQRNAAGLDAAVIFWENVPGVLSTKDNAFGCFLAGLAGEDEPLQPAGKKWANAGAVYGPARTVAWRTLDAQYFGVAQRRRRVFVVASARGDIDPAQVLFEWDGLRRDTAPRRGQGKNSAANAAAGPAGSGLSAFTTKLHNTASNNAGKLFEEYSTCLDANSPAPAVFQPVAFDTTQVTSAANRSNPKPGDPCHPLAAGAHAPAIAFQQTADCLTAAYGTKWNGNASATNGSLFAGHPVAFPANLSGTQHASTENLAPAMGAKNPTAVAVSLRGREGGATAEMGDEVQNCLRASSGGGDKPHILTAMQVRRLTPRECERLQGFPDDYTAIPWRKKPASECPDGPRYKALGNSWAVPVVRWIGRRIQEALNANP